MLRLKDSCIKLYPSEKGYIDQFTESTIVEFQEACEQKFERLYRPPHARFDNKAVVNITDVTVPEDILLALSFGPKFCFPVVNNVLNTITFLDNIDGAISWAFPTETYNEAYKQVSIEMTKERTHKNAQTRDVWLDLLRHRIHKFKKQHPDIHILRSDKGKHTVLINRDLYEDKMNGLVRTDDYLPIDNINIKNLEIRNNKFVEQLIACGTIKADERWMYLDYCSLPARIYGLIKIHKLNFPMRPIVSACGSPGFKLAKLITTLLSNIFPEKGLHIKDSFDFIKQLGDIQIADCESMSSFDVVSMFTNIPIDLMIGLIKRRSSLIYHQYNLDFELLKDILIFLLRDCALFTWKSEAFKQKDSLAMGSPLSPILARILMTDVMNYTLPLLKSKPKLVALYVDDSFWISRSIDLQHALTVLNSYHPKIKFIIENEQNSSINFLDVTIIRDRNCVITNWYRKPFASLRILNYFSQHEKSCILETAIAFIHRILQLSNEKFFLDNKPLVEEILFKNSFPETEIITLLHENYTFMKPKAVKQKFDGKYVPIKYRGSLTSNIKKKLMPLINDGRLVGIPDRSCSNHFSSVKDKVDIRQKTNIVIWLVCQCQGTMIFRHTKFKSNADLLVSELISRYGNSGSKCSSDLHRYPGFRTHQCKNYGSTKNIYNMLTFAYRDKLIDTVMGLPVFQISKQIVNARFDYEINND